MDDNSYLNSVCFNNQPAKTLCTLLVIIAVLVVLHLCTGLVAYFNDVPWALDLYFVFNVGSDQSIPTHFAVSAWLVSAGLALKLSRKTGNAATVQRGWKIIAYVSLFLSVDELAMFHERLTGPFRRFFGTEGYLWYAWVIPYGIGVIIIFLVLTKFLLSQPRKIGGLLILSGVIFVAGAVGFEMVGADMVFRGEEKGIPYRLIFTIEETLEMVGVSVFIYTLLLSLQLNTEKTLDR